MQQEGKPKFLKHHTGSVRSVSFNPKDRYLFCSGGNDGKVVLYSALYAEMCTCYQTIISPHSLNITGVRFAGDGSKILASTNARKVSVIDVETGTHVVTYHNCVYTGRSRTALATDPSEPNIVVFPSMNGKGLTLVDLRMQLPLDFVNDIHDHVIRDICFTRASWPWQNSILATSADGTCKIISSEGQELHSFKTGHIVNAVCLTPEPFCRTNKDRFHSLIVCGGDSISAYVPDLGIQETIKDKNGRAISKLKYTSNGGMLYSACNDGVLRRYRRYPRCHELLGEVYQHKWSIQDFDISSYDEYIVSASTDGSVGLLLLGAPNHGFTSYTELT